MSRLNSETSIAITIQKQSDANSVKTSDRLRATFAELERDNGGRIRFTVAQDLTDFTRNSLSEVQRDLFLAILMVAIVTLPVPSQRTEFVTAFCRYQRHGCHLFFIVAGWRSPLESLMFGSSLRS